MVSVSTDDIRAQVFRLGGIAPSGSPGPTRPYSPAAASFAILIRVAGLIVGPMTTSST